MVFWHMVLCNLLQVFQRNRLLLSLGKTAVRTYPEGWESMLTQKFIQGAEKTPCPNFVGWQGGPKQRFAVKELCVGDTSLQHYGLSNWVWLRLHIFLEYGIIYHRAFNLCVTVVTRNVFMLDLLHQLWLQTTPTAMPWTWSCTDIQFHFHQL